MTNEEWKVPEGCTVAALFDLDGVVLDTESQYSVFWNRIGEEYHPEVEHFGRVIKGQTLVQIYDRWFAGLDNVQAGITARLNAFEAEMSFPYIKGAREFIEALRRAGVKTAVVTSSNAPKMARVYAARPELPELFDAILTSEHFAESKPHPDCYLKGARALGVGIADCVVFEDSFHGLESGRRAGMKVVGLATTNSCTDIADKCHHVEDDFAALTPEFIYTLLGRM